MMQGIKGLGIGATGTVGTLIVAGIVLIVSGISPRIGQIAITFGVLIGIALGFLGVLSVIKKIFG